MVKYARVLAVLLVVVAGGVAAVALTRSGRPSPTAQLHRTVRQEVLQLQGLPGAKPWVLPGVGHALAPPGGSGTCFVNAGTCSIKPCVIPVAAHAPTVMPAFPVPQTGCPLGDRVPRAYRVTAGPPRPLAGPLTAPTPAP